jgi:hypothetical protein
LNAWPRVRPNLPWLAVVFALTALGQWFVLHDGAVPIVSSDGSLYIQDAHLLPAIQGLVDPKVPPGYPIMLAAIFAVAGRDNLLAVLIVQAILLIAALIELYAFMVIATVPRWLAMAAAGLLGASPWLAQWELYILTEAFSFWAVVTLMLLTATWVRRPSTRAAIACGLVGASIPLVRPALVPVPATVLIVLMARSFLSRVPGPTHVPAMTLLLFVVVSYLPVGGYVTANAMVNKCYCFTNISNLNLFGKIYEYNMTGFPADPQFATIAAQVHESTGLNQFLTTHPEYEAQNYVPLGNYARSQLLRYPGYTARRTLSEIRKVLTLQIDHAVYVKHTYVCRGDPAAPYPSMTRDAVPPSDLPSCLETTPRVGTFGELTNALIYSFVAIGYAALPGGLLLGFLLVLMRPARDRAWLMLLAMAVPSVVVVASAVGGYESFDRLKLPVDGVALAAFALFLTEMGWLARELARSVRPATGTTLG